jgi:enoyl-CoA hydratase/carnithine racemase
MGGHYFSNGIALNTIEHRGNRAPSVEDADQWAGEETWHNINAIDDVVEFLAGDTCGTRSTKFAGETLCERGVTTVAVMRGNAAAGGVALAAACDINPAYRGMGLHGSEFHS